MNKREVTASVAERTGIDQETCATVIDAVEHISGTTLLKRIKGQPLDEAAAVQEIAEKSGVPQDQCLTIMRAFEETFGDALSSKFRLFKK